MTPELQSQIAQWRAKERAGTLTLDDMREAVAAMREGRKSAAAASESARKSRAKKQVKSADQLLGELEGL